MNLLVMNLLVMNLLVMNLLVTRNRTQIQPLVQENLIPQNLKNKRLSWPHGGLSARSVTASRETLTTIEGTSW